MCSARPFAQRFIRVFEFLIFSDLHLYKAVLVIPDVYTRGHLKELMNLLLLKMGFGSCFLVQVSFSHRPKSAFPTYSLMPMWLLMAV